MGFLDPELPKIPEGPALRVRDEIGSVRLLVNDLWTSPQPRIKSGVELTPAGLTTFHESFLRFPSLLFRDVFSQLLGSCS